MPDLTIEYHVQCASMDRATASVGGYVQSGLFDERRWPTCTCPAYKYGKRTINFGGRMVPPECKHILEAQETLCHYQSYIDGSPDEEGVCPNCGGPLMTITVAV